MSGADGVTRISRVELHELWNAVSIEWNNQVETVMDCEKMVQEERERDKAVEGGHEQQAG
jgi:hypothetical protein